MAVYSSGHNPVKTARHHWSVSGRCVPSALSQSPFHSHRVFFFFIFKPWCGRENSILYECVSDDKTTSDLQIQIGFMTSENNLIKPRHQDNSISFLVSDTRTSPPFIYPPVTTNKEPITQINSRGKKTVN